MTYTLSQGLQDLYTDLGLGQSRKITSTGTTTTSVDSTDTDANAEGSIIVISSTDALAPQGEFGRITAYASGGTWTHDAITVATGAGDYVLINRSDLPLYDAIEAYNRALRSLGDLDWVDTSTLETVAQQTEYTAAVAWKRKRPKRIDIQTKLDDSNDNRWQTITDFDYIPAAANSTGLIIFKSQPNTLRDLRIWYEDVHPRVTTYNAYIREELHPEIVRQAALLAALEFMISQTGRGVDPQLVQDRNKAATALDMAKQMHGKYRERRMPKFTDLGNTMIVDQFTYPSA